MALLTAYRVAYDAVTVDNIPADALYAFYYENGAFADEAAVRARCPHATLCGITVVLAAAPMCDSETGDLTVPQTRQYVDESLAAGVYKPRIYANASRWESEGLLSELAPYGSRIRRAIADFDGIPSIPAGYNAKQYRTNGVDVWVTDDEFFDDSPPLPPAPPAPKGIARAELEVNLADLAWSLTPQSGEGEMIWRSEEEYASLEIQLGVGGKLAGKWRHESLPFGAPPLGK